jgi:hypothetical protein
MTSESKYSTYDSGKQVKIISDLMDLFRSNQRGYGVGEFTGARFDEDKNKWIPGHVRWSWGETTSAQWHDHLSGVRLLGQGVLCDDNRVWYASLDIDIYDVDYIEVMIRVRQSGLPLVVYRTKSGGLRVTVFFCEGVEADLVIPRMRRIASLLGYAGCEIFPKQSKLDVTNGDCPSWIYMPYGGTNDMFPEQGCMNEGGGLMELEEGIEYAKGKRITKERFLQLFTAEETAKANGKANGKKHPRGSWVQEETYEATIDAMFSEGPPCLWTIAHNRSHEMQNNFLFNVAMFLRKKYPENWGKPLEYVNYNVLQPVGDRDKLNSIISRSPDKNYLCQQEPICSHCISNMCRRQPYGVGANGVDVDYRELGITVIDREPNTFFVNIGDNGKRLQCSFEELWYIRKFQIKCGDSGSTVPFSIKQLDWEFVVRKGLEEATHVPPSRVIRTNADELDILTKFFNAYLPNYMRVGEKEDDKVRIRQNDRRIYFKEQRLLDWCRMTPGYNGHTNAMRWFIHNKCEHHEQGPGGFRGWWRGTYSVLYDILEVEDVEKWLNMGTQSADEEDRQS